MNKRRFISLFLILLLLLPTGVRGARKKNSTQVDRVRIAALLTRITGREVMGNTVKVADIRTSGKVLRIYASAGLANYPFRPGNVAAMYDSVRLLLPASMQKYRLEIYTDGYAIENLVPLSCRRSFDRRRISTFTNSAARPLVRALDAVSAPRNGLQERHIALWQSHGRYFDQTENRWKWQRVAGWQTREDLFTQSFVLPFLVPMLERAGANVLLPRERDVQKCEILVDGDPSVEPCGRYVEQDGREAWYDAGVGFAHRRRVYRDGQNPFREGRVRGVRTVNEAQEESRAQWWAEIPERGEYAVYVSYGRYGDSAADDACYTVHHAGGRSRFAVNQQMGGGTWIYLGHFDLEAGKDRLVVELSNRSAVAGRVVSADAVKIGGGYGNSVRDTRPELRKEGMIYCEQTSAVPRFCEGARYWLQWAGFPEEVYSPQRGCDDYKDDYMCRAHWVNALAGGSERLADSVGLGIPLDLALAFHSDAGLRGTDETIGTLGIFYTKDQKGLFDGGISRYRSRDLTDVVMTQVVGDIRAMYEPEWRRRGLWNRSYYEARVPAVPTMLLELLSHQNFADMRYGHDPCFKFLVSRAIYKGILRHVATQYGYEAVVQPLPVDRFAVRFAEDDPDVVELAWQPRNDVLEPTAVPDSYIVYTRVDDGGFDNGRRVEGCGVRLRQERGHLYSYRVTAVNRGGESFPSQTLAAGRAVEERGRVAVVNGFDRLSGPPSFRRDSLVGFDTEVDGGVAYLRDIAYIGRQNVFDFDRLMDRNPATALGACDDGFESEIAAGNSFDYAAVHGRSILRAGYSFCSFSSSAVEADPTLLRGADACDLIYGKQRATCVGSGFCGERFACFTEGIQRALRNFDGRGIFVSGSYIASDLPRSSVPGARDFVREVLGYDCGGERASAAGRVHLTHPDFTPAEYRFNQRMNPAIYTVESPDALRPAAEGARTVMHYADSRRSAAVASEVAGRRCLAMGFPFETIEGERARNTLMGDVLRYICRQETLGEEIAEK